MLILFGTGGTDSDARTYIDRVESADQATLELEVRQAINEFFVQCKQNGNLANIKNSCLMAGPRTFAGILQPLVGSVAPTQFNFLTNNYNRKTGLRGDTISKYLNTNRVNGADPQDNHHYATYMTVAPTTATTCLMGSGRTNTGATGLFGNETRNRNPQINSRPVVLGFYGMIRTNSTDYTVRNGGSEAIINTVSQVPSVTENTFIFARTQGASPNAHTNARLSFYSIGTAVNLAQLDQSITSYMNKLGLIL